MITSLINNSLFKMDILNELYYKSVTENERNLTFWDGYLQNLKSLDFNANSDKLKVPVLVPIGSRILFRGELKHTNEVTVALGADYFVKCSSKQADVIRQHRIKGAQEKVDILNKEKDYLQNQMSFTKQNVYDNQGEEIIEYHTEDEDIAWRKKHKDNVREYMQNKAKEKKEDNMTDEDLWYRLDELELQEELLNEYNDDTASDITESKKESFNVKEDTINETILKSEDEFKVKDVDKANKELKNKKVTLTANQTSTQTSTLNLLQQVIDKQNELDEKLHELKNRERSQSKTEEDIISRLDELEQLDELEDEMDRLEDIIDNEDIDEIQESEVESSKSDTTNHQRRVTFFDQDESKTLDLNFKHSETEPSNEPYDPDKGIQKPSDLYKAYSNLFGNETVSILKKPKYATNSIKFEEKQSELNKPDVKKVRHENTQLQTETKDLSSNGEEPNMSTKDAHRFDKNPVIIIDDVVEKVGQEDKKLQTETKRISIFKKTRMQNKSSI